MYRNALLMANHGAHHNDISTYDCVSGPSLLHLQPPTCLLPVNLSTVSPLQMKPAQRCWRQLRVETDDVHCPVGRFRTWQTIPISAAFLNYQLYSRNSLTWSGCVSWCRSLLASPGEILLSQNSSFRRWDSSRPGLWKCWAFIGAFI